MGESELEAQLADFCEEREEQANHDSAVAVCVMFAVMIMFVSIAAAVALVHTIEDHTERIEKIERRLDGTVRVYPYC